MGYQVGNYCYATKQEAENVYFSLVAPVVSTTTTTATLFRPQQITSTIVKPEYINGKWLLNGKVITANLPPCDPVKNMQNGAELGWLIFGIMAAMYAFTLIKRLLK